MPDFMTDGQPWEPPESAREEGYAATPSSFGKTFGALMEDTSTSAALNRSMNRAVYEDTAWGRIVRGLGQAAGAEAGLSVAEDPTDPYAPAPAKQLTAEEANERYAPTGPDGKPVKIADGPIPEPVAQMVGKAKAAEIEREGVLNRYAQNSYWPTRFATGTAAFLMDPINIGAMFLPGVGEDAALAGFARLGIRGTSLATRVAARAVSGATAGLAGQAPLSLAKVAMGADEASDYDLRSAFRDMMFGAAGGAIMQAGFGTLGELLTGRRGRGELASSGETRIAPSATAAGPEPRIEAEQAAAAAPTGIARYASPDEIAEIRALIERKAEPEEIRDHPAITRARTDAEGRPETVKEPGFGTPEWEANRKFTVGGREVTGYPAGVDALVEKAKSYSTDAPVENGRQAVIVLGPPASGKSAIAERLATGLKAAIVDADDVKTAMPEYDGGAGAPALHEESSLISGMVRGHLQGQGANMVLPLVGAKADSIRTRIDQLKADGYDVHLVNMAVNEKEAYRRMIRRFVKTGRIIGSEYFSFVDAKPEKVFNELKGEGKLGETLNIDGNGPPASLRATEGADTRLAQILRLGGEAGPARGGGVPAGQEGERQAVLNADPATRAAAMRVGVAQVVEGAPVNVEPVLAPQNVTPAQLAALEAEAARNGYAPGIPQSVFDAIYEAIYGERKPGEPEAGAAGAEGSELSAAHGEAPHSAAAAGEAPQAAPAGEAGPGAVPAGGLPARQEGAAPGGVIDNTHDVVSGANSSRDPNGPVYVDRRIPQFSPTLKDRNGNPADLWKYLAIHERTEAKAMADGMSYDDAHTKVATPAERAAVEADGVDWTAYTREMDGYLDHIEHETAENPPPDTHVDPQAAIGHHRSENKAAPKAGETLESAAPARGGAGAAVGLPSAAPVPSAIPNVVASFRPADLGVDADRFQFKAGGDEAGVTDRLKGVTKWDPIKAGMVLVWRDRDGKPWIVDGHQRLALAKRIAEADPAQDPQLMARVLEESQGVTDRDARTIAALKNIAEGTGTAVDAAKVLRENPERAGELPPRSELYRQAQGLVNLSDDAFRMVINDVVSPAYAAVVGRLVPSDHAMQSALLGLLAKTEPANLAQAENIVRQGIEAGIAKKAAGSQASLFGDDDVAESLYIERAKVLDRAMKEIKADKKVFSVLTREQSAIEQAGNKLAADVNQKRAAADAQALQILQTLANRKGPISDALGKAAERARADGKYPGAIRDFVGSVRALMDGNELARLADGLERGAVHVGDESPAGVVERAAESVKPAQATKASAEVARVLEEAKKAPVTEAGAEGLPQIVMPGMERSAVQAAAAREAAGGMRPQAQQAEPGGLFAPRPQPAGTDLFTAKLYDVIKSQMNKDLDRQLADAEASLQGVAFAPADQAELARAAQGLQEADSLTAAYAQAAECLIEAVA